MNLWKEYHRAENLSDALQALSTAPGSVSVLAGGTDLLLDMQQGRHAPVYRLVDVTCVQEMRLLEIRQEALFIGAAVPITQIVRSPLVQEHAQALVEACDLIGGPQVRNTATLGGNVAHALPAADGTIALVAMDAQAEIASDRGLRCVPVRELFRGPGKSALELGKEILVGFYLQMRLPGQASAFKRVMRPQGVALPILNLAAWMHRQGDQILDARIAVGPAGPTPHRSQAAEDTLRGNTLTPELIEAALIALQSQASFRTSKYRATANYRRHIVGGLLRQVLTVAWERALLA
jgi:xanthine dehydrogenase FAD-binding subunit